MKNSFEYVDAIPVGNWFTCYDRYKQKPITSGYNIHFLKVSDKKARVIELTYNDGRQDTSTNRSNDWDITQSNFRDGQFTEIVDEGLYESNAI